MKRRYDVFIVGYYGRGNFGDEQSLRQLRSWIEELAPGCSVGTNAPFDSFGAVFQNCFSVLTAQVVIFGNGNIFQSESSHRSFYAYLFLLLLSRLLLKPTAALSQGIGPLSHLETLLLTCCTVGMVWVSRDGTSPRFARSVSGLDIAELSPPVFMYDENGQDSEYYGAGHEQLIDAPLKNRLVRTDRLHVALEAEKAGVELQLGRAPSKVRRYLDYRRQFTPSEQRRYALRNRRVLRWALRWQLVNDPPFTGLIYSFNPQVFYWLKERPLLIRRGLLDSFSLRLHPRLWFQRLRRGVDAAAAIIREIPGEQLVIVGAKDAPVSVLAESALHYPVCVSTLEPGALAKELSTIERSHFLVALPSPEQEEVGERIAELLPDRTILLCGGSIDALLKRKVYLPRFLHSLGLEWAVTLLFHPERARRLPSVAVGLIRGWKMLR